MAHFTILIFLSSVLFASSVGLPSDDIKTLIYTYQYKYCGGQFCAPDISYQPPKCLEDTTFIDSENVSTLDNGRCNPCSECSCDDSCSFLGNCCADKRIGDTYFLDCRTILKYKEDETEEDAYVIVTKCLANAPNYTQDLAWKCEHGEMGYIQDGRLVTAPHPFDNSVTFRNKYCAMCYGVTNYTYADVYISCYDDFDTSNYSDINAMIRSVKESSSCVVSLDLPKDRMPRLCVPSHSMISTCNVTGRWQEYNPSIKTACESYFRPTKTWEYRNIFCQLCNGGTTEELECPSKCTWRSVKHVSFRPFTVLLNFENSDAEIVKSSKSDYQIKRIGKQAAHQCRKEDIYDMRSKVCREVYCALAEGSTNSTCVRLVQSQQQVLTLWKITALYKAEIIFEVEVTPPSLAKAVIGELQYVLGEFGFVVHRLDADDLARINSITSLIVTESSLDLTLFLLSEFVLDLSQEKLKDKFTLNISWFGRHIETDVVTRNNDITNRLQLSQYHIVAGHSEMLNINMKETIVVPVIFNVSCSMVRFTSQEVETINSTVIIHTNNILTEDEYFITETGDYFICLNVLARRGNPITKTLFKDDLNDTLTGPLLTGICLSLSLLFLLITMLVYIFIKELHTVPGLNLIFLTSSVFVAQAFYLFGAGTVTTPTICTVLGVLIHYFWLVSFAWMNVCCFHMFRVFTNAFSSLDFALNKKWLMFKYSIFVYGTAAVIITLTVVTTFILSGTKTIAYGRTTLCFVSPGLVSVISFGVPAGLAVSVNTVFLVVTTLRLRNTIKASHHLGRSEANDISKFFKLSTITGISWVFGFLGYFLQRDELLYVFTVLTAGQGVFIFLSFVVSRRIFALVKDKLCPKKKKRNTRLKVDVNSESLENTATSGTQQITIKL